MSTINENEQFSNILEFKDDIEHSPFSFEDIDEFPIFKKEEEESHSSYIFSDKKGNPLIINNENFVNYFMHIDYNTPLTKESMENLKNNINILDDKSIIKEDSSQPSFPSSQNNSNSSNENKKKCILSKKTKKEKEYGILTDSKTGITYNEEDDPINYRKAKKRIQNRESALRIKKMRESGTSKLEEEIEHLREDNVRLINENISLKKEKEFLIEQIKFMQKIIKESNLEFKLKNACSDKSDTNSNSSNEETGKEPVFYYNGSKQKIKGKLFNVFIICTLSLIYIIGECTLNGDKSNNQNLNMRNGHSIHLNSIKEKEIMKYSVWFYLSKILLIVIFLLIIPLFKEIGNIFEMIFKRNKKYHYYNL